MKCIIRKWKREDAEDLYQNINDLRILNNLTDRIPYPYHLKDAHEYIEAMLSADENEIFAFAIEYEGKVAGSISVLRQDDIYYKCQYNFVQK